MELSLPRHNSINHQHQQAHWKRERGIRQFVELQVPSPLPPGETKWMTKPIMAKITSRRLPVRARVQGPMTMNRVCGPGLIPCKVSGTLRDQNNFHTTVLLRDATAHEIIEQGVPFRTPVCCASKAPRGCNHHGDTPHDSRDTDPRKPPELSRTARANQAVEPSIVHTSPYRKRAGQHRLQNPSAHTRKK